MALCDLGPLEVGHRCLDLGHQAALGPLRCVKIKPRASSSPPPRLNRVIEEPKTVWAIDQNFDSQRDAVAAGGCDEAVVDKASDKLAQRPELDKGLLEAPEDDQLVITKLDRLGRSLEHLIALSNELQAKCVDLVVLDQGIDPSSALGRMFFQILGAIAEFEHALMSERTTAWAQPGPAAEREVRNPS